MNTTMQTHKTSNKVKVAGAGLLAAAMLGVGSFVYNAESSHADNSTMNTSSSASSTSSQNAATTAPNTGGQDGLIISATNYYIAQQQAQATGTAYSPQKVYDIQTVGYNARAKLSNGDSGSVVYLHYTPPQSAGHEGMWSVMYGGQTTVSAALVSQYGMPSSWSSSTNW